MKHFLYLVCALLLCAGGLQAAETAKYIELKGHTPAPPLGVTFAAFSPDGKQIVTASMDKTARIWDIESGTELRKLEGHTGNIQSVAFSPDGKRIVTASRDNTARIWTLE